MQNAARLISVSVMLALLGACQSQVDLGELFAEHGLEGTLVIENLDGSIQYIHNPARASQRFRPASTFKIPNTLIALDEEVIHDEREIIPWDSVERFIPAWNADQSLETAFPISCVWFYQELARRVGVEAYQRQLDRLAYGNCQPGPQVDTFWLEGDLAISAMEQIAFLKDLHHAKLPYDPAQLDVLKRIMVIDERKGYTLRGKTGWTHRGEGYIGWFVGYLAQPNETWFFALNYDATEFDQAAYRQEIVLDALKRLGIQP